MGKLPTAAQQLPTGTILVEEPNPHGPTVLYARVSCADQNADLKRQVQRLEAFARKRGWEDFDVVAEVGSGLNGKGRKLLRVLRDPKVSRIVVEHRDRLARFGMVEAALASAGKRVAVVKDGEVKDDPVRDILEILTSACARLYGRRSARNRAKKALGHPTRSFGSRGDPREVLRCG